MCFEYEYEYDLILEELKKKQENKSQKKIAEERREPQVEQPKEMVEITQAVACAN